MPKAAPNDLGGLLLDLTRILEYFAENGTQNHVMQSLLRAFSLG